MLRPGYSTAGSLSVQIGRVAGDHQLPEFDNVAVEEPLEIQLSWPADGGTATKSVSITMRTPGEDAELAVGFLATEAIINSARQITAVRHCGPPAPGSGYRNVIRVELAAEVAADLGRLERHFHVTSSCGVCGKASLDALRVAGQESLTAVTTRFPRDVLLSMPAKLRVRQGIFSVTGGLHAAAAFTPDGEVVLVREDVGRHNAVDKVVGALLLQNRLPAHGLGLLVSGRASFELLQKALVAGMPLLAAVSAPSSLAVQLASQFDITLVGFLRDITFNVYHDAGRLA